MIRVMLQRAKEILLIILGFGLPLHGAITVFGSDVSRWWKEVVLLLLCALVGVSLLRGRTNFWGLGFKLKRLIAHPALWAACFLVWGLALVLINQDLHTALVAYRYLGLGVFVFLLGLIMWKSRYKSVKNGHSFGLELFHKFCTGLTLGVFASTLFGVWGKFFGGYGLLDQWYSKTISSWVPGQTIPLYHQVGDFVRVQGASSGPVEYSHLVVLGLWYVLFFKPESLLKRTNVRFVLSLVFLTGVWQSGSRAALMGGLILLLAKLYITVKPKLRVLNFKWTIDKAAAAYKQRPPPCRNLDCPSRRWVSW